MTAKLNNSENVGVPWYQQSELLLSIGLLASLGVMLVPLPTFLLDMLLALNLAQATLLLLITLGTRHPLELSVFPSLLLLLTLFRLTLNIATTRLILLEADAGRIVSTFGSLVVGGNLIVGLVIFLILVIIQFVVITKGSGRISEVAARFTLDALPGKQMAIDAELNGGAITMEIARERRESLARETDFYGSMDGAGKFVRGDAIAGLIITAVNLIGGVVIGMTDGLGFLESMRTYSILTVGDGLVSQIPALIIATTAGILVTKTSSNSDLGQEISTQILRNERPLWTGAAMLAVLAVMPGFPKLPFLMLSAGLLIYLNKKSAKPVELNVPEQTGPTDDPGDREQLDDFLIRERASVEVGSRLIPLVKSSQSKGIAERITLLRRDFAKSNGLWIPPIRVVSNLELASDSYRVQIAGRVVATGELRIGQLLAILPEGRTTDIPGVDTTEPAFGLSARWIDRHHQRQAELAGCTVVDPISVLITHLGELLKQYGHEMITREDLKGMLDRVREFAPTIVEELKPDAIKLGALHRVITRLAAERVPMSDLSLVLEAIGNHVQSTKDVDALVELVRADLGAVICERYRDEMGSVRVISLHPHLEAGLRERLRDGQLLLGATPLERLLDRVGREAADARRRQQPLALLTDSGTRRPLVRIFGRALPELGVLSYQEIPHNLAIHPVTMLRADDVFDEPAEAQNHPVLPRHTTDVPSQSASAA
ncbi:MAG: FHIPEP family type III secretion protein [Planctomycetaceae bacterium]|nr:FHIPEP family type III secretion protein [Planctomycetaceae bacterium]